MAEPKDRIYQAQCFQRWLGEITNAQRDDKYKQWIKQSERIVERYRDERTKGATQNVSTKRYNILWSNVQTLGPAVYGKAPKPYAERRFLDRDPVARLASLILERTLAFQMSVGKFHEATKKAVHKDYLLPGMGQVWLRYYPEFEASKDAYQNEELEESQDEQASEGADQEADEGFGEVYDKLKYETVCFDYVYWRDFLWSPSRNWSEVPWVAKRCWLDYAESEEQFGKEIADRMTFGDPKNKELADTLSNEQPILGKSKKAEVWEIWCKPERKVYIIASETPDVVLKEQDDPLNLEGFYPCPEPIFSTQTNDTLVPVPDYIEYQDQALELDDLTDRIDNIISAVRVNGTYNAEYKALERLLQKGQDNMLIPVDDWASFAEKGGMTGAISLIDIKPVIEALQQLTVSREQVLQDIYQITGISDIIRGQGDAQETATAQKIKANYATGRLGSRQERVAEFCADLVRIAAEIIAEIFSDQSLRQMSGIDQLFADQVREAVESVSKPQIPAPSPQNPSAGQLAQQQAMVAWGQAKQQAGLAKQNELEQQFQQALALLRSDKLRGFRVDIETDSTIADDLQQDKQAVTEFVQGLFQSIQGAEQTIAAAPELVKPMGETILFAARKFRVGRALEAAWEDALDKLEKRIDDMKNQPPQPSPEMIKAQADMQVAQANIQKTQAETQAETARSEADIRVQQIQFASDQQKAQLEQQIEALKIELQARQSSEQTLTDRQKAFLSYLQAVRVAEINAGVATDESQVDAQIETLLGFAKIAHEANQNELDRQHEAGMASVQQQHDRQMQKEAPKPNATNG